MFTFPLFNLKSIQIILWVNVKLNGNAWKCKMCLFHCLITFSSEIDIRGRLVFGRAAQRHNNVRLSAIQKPPKSPRTLEYVITLKFYRWTLSRKNKHRPMASACCLSLSLCCIHIFHRLKCFSHSWKLLERDVRERKESGRWELRPKKKKLSHYPPFIILPLCISLYAFSVLCHPHHFSTFPSIFLSLLLVILLFLGGGLGRRKSGELPWQQQAGWELPVLWHRRRREKSKRRSVKETEGWWQVG